MAEKPTETEAPVPQKKSKLPLILGLVLFLAGAGGGFFAVQKGLVLGDHGDQRAETGHAEVAPLPDIAFVPIEPLVINLGDGARSRYLRFQAQIEVDGPHAADVEKLLPRIVDVLNGYLRAVDLSTVEDRSALVRIRAQMLRRIQLVAGAGRVRDLLITEFVLN
jgi:flagellar FliL protein